MKPEDRRKMGELREEIGMKKKKRKTMVQLADRGRSQKGRSKQLRVG